MHYNSYTSIYNTTASKSFHIILSYNQLNQDYMYTLTIIQLILLEYYIIIYYVIKMPYICLAIKLYKEWSCLATNTVTIPDYSNL